MWAFGGSWYVPRDDFLKTPEELSTGGESFRVHLRLLSVCRGCRHLEYRNQQSWIKSQCFNWKERTGLSKIYQMVIAVVMDNISGGDENPRQWKEVLSGYHTISNGHAWAESTGCEKESCRCLHILSGGECNYHLYYSGKSVPVWLEGKSHDRPKGNGLKSARDQITLGFGTNFELRDHGKVYSKKREYDFLEIIPVLCLDPTPFIKGQNEAHKTDMSVQSCTANSKP